MRRPWLIPAVIALVVAGSAATASAKDVITGRLVDSACYNALGKEQAPETDLEKCSITGAQKGQRLALVTERGEVYLVTGLLAQNNNKRLMPLINRIVVLTGVVTEAADAVDAVGELLGGLAGGLLGKDPKPDPAPDDEPDTRRHPKRDNEVDEKHDRTGDFREGDPQTGTATSIDATSALDLVTRLLVQ